MSTRLLVSFFAVLGLTFSIPVWAKSVKKKANISKTSKKRVNSKAGKHRERHIVRENVSRGSNNVNFEEVDIEGQSKMPLDGIVNSNKSNKGYEFVKIRSRWHPEMIRSVTQLGYSGSRKR